MNEMAFANWLLPRPPASHPYRLPPAVLTVPWAALERTVALFRPYAAREVEACCFWYGPRDEHGNGQVTAVVAPRQHNHRGRYDVPAMSMAAVAEATRPRGWRNLAQLHGHPGRAVEHSRYDDAYANSRRALSLVLPDYGVWQGIWPCGIGVHEFQDGYWHLLTDADAAHRVIVVVDAGPIAVVDLR